MTTRELFYTNYVSGKTGLSNSIMSLEVGVILAFLTNRYLVIEGNESPSANVVTYDGRVKNARPSRVTDLIDLPVSWGEANGNHAHGPELTSHSLWDLAFCFPATLDVHSADARSFAHVRKHWVAIGEEHDRAPVLRLSEDPVVPGTDTPRRNLGFYGYLFYFDDETRRSVYRLLRRMTAKRELAELARRVSRDLGDFNAVHLRRGDFKVTYGVTTLQRQSWEAIDALDQHFRRDELLVIATDERNDPFFDEIKAAYPRHVFIDHHVLAEYERELTDLPASDSVALAYLSQLIAADAKDFIGTMTSTFTALIHRYRGNRGVEEPFKFLWNELPALGDPLVRGRQSINECVPLDRGIMVEEHSGPYTWNRYNPRINPAWMREWPESFLTPSALETGALTTRSASPATSVPLVVGEQRIPPNRTYVEVENLRVAIRTESAELLQGFSRAFDAPIGSRAENVIAEIRIESETGKYRLSTNGQPLAEVRNEDLLLRGLCEQLAILFGRARRVHSWLRGAAFERAGRAVVVVGDLARQTKPLVDALAVLGWNLLGDEVVPIRATDRTVQRFCRSWRPRTPNAPEDRNPVAVSHIIVASHRPYTRDGISDLSPSVAVAEMIGSCLDFGFDRDRAVERLCRLGEQCRTVQLHFSTAARAAELVDGLLRSDGSGEDRAR